MLSSNKIICTKLAQLCINSITAAPTILSSPMNTSAPLNTEITFSCTIVPEVASEVVVTWSGPDSPLPSPVNSEENGMITSNLTVNVSDGRHQFELYSCSVSYVNCLMVATSNPAAFSIIPPPMIIEPPMGGDFDINSFLSLICMATNYGTVTVTWTGPTSDLQGTDLVNDTVISSNYSTLLSNHSLGGNYTCIATNEAGSDSASTIVFIRPVVMPEVVLASIGDEVTLVCQVQTYPSSTICWERENSLGMFEVINTVDMLTFVPLKFGDEGTYRCVASVDGSNKTSTTLSRITSKYIWLS